MTPENDFNPNENSESGSKFQDYGKKSLAPMVNLLHSYQGDITPYMSALRKGLQAAVDSFEQDVEGSETSDVDRTVARWFGEANDWFNGMRGHFESKSPKDLLNFLETEAKDRPVVLFATSYVAGILFGRIGKHLFHAKSNMTEPTTEASSFSDESTNQIH